MKVLSRTQSTPFSPVKPSMQIHITALPVAQEKGGHTHTYRRHATDMVSKKQQTGRRISPRTDISLANSLFELQTTCTGEDKKCYEGTDYRPPIRNGFVKTPATVTGRWEPSVVATIDPEGG